MKYWAWSLPRRAFGSIAAQIALYRTPPIADHVELFLFGYGFLLLSSSSPLGLFLLVAMIALMHVIRGRRWQLYGLYAAILLWYFKHNPIVHYLRILMFILAVLLCVIFPVMPPLLPHYEHQEIGIQDFCLRTPLLDSSSEFWTRVYYPCKAHRRTTGIDLWVQVFIAFLSIIVMFAAASPFDRPLGLMVLFLVGHTVLDGLEYIWGVPKSDYMPDKKLSHTGLARYVKLPEILFSHLPLAWMCCHEDGEPSAQVPMKIAVVLHGLSGLRTTYTALCMRLASEGYLVVSPEFGDGTPAVTVLPTSHRYYEPFTGKPGTAEEHEFRHRQLQHRQLELNLLMRFLELLNRDITASGKRAQIFADMVRSVRWRRYGSNRNSAFVDQIGGKIDTTGVHLIGHSFGGATALYIATSADEPAVEFREKYHVCSVVLLDPWMYPLSDALREGKTEFLAAPVLCMHAEYFQWPKNLEFETAVVSRSKPCIQLRLRDTGHVNYTETSLFSPIISYLRRSNGWQEPEHILRDVNEITTEFAKCFNDSNATTEKNKEVRVDMGRVKSLIESSPRLFSLLILQE
jgi:dienelactone hydrolase